MGDADAGPTYILGTEERRRLELLEECLDPLTIRALDGIGVGPGWRCLEVGAGGGSVARLLCERAGPAGRVAAVDLDTRFLDELTEENLEIHRRDVVGDGLPGDGYDLVHARMLLMHLPTREKFLEQLASVLRPGGWLLVEDLDVFPVHVLTDGLYGRMWQAAEAAFHLGNAASTLGRRLPGLFCAAGLESVEAICDVPVFRGGEPWSDLILASMDQLRPAVLATGLLTEAEITELPAMLADPSQWFTTFSIFSVRGRAPDA